MGGVVARLQRSRAWDGVEEPRVEDPGCADRRPRFLRWLLPIACASAVPLTGEEQAELKFMAYH